MLSCDAGAQTCYHRSGSKLDHAAAMRYCRNNHEYFPLLVKTKEELQAVARKFPDSSDIWYAKKYVILDGDKARRQF